MGAPNAMVRFPDSPSVSWFLDEWTASGATHHQALMPGDVSRELIDALSAAAIEPVHVS
jgi:L-arabinose isomerase